MSEETTAVAVRGPSVLEVGDPDRIDGEALMRFASTIAKSGLFGVRDGAQAFGLMALAHAEGMHPMKALQRYHIIEGKPSMRADAMLAAFHDAGGKHQWLTSNDTVAEAKFTHPVGGTLTVKRTLKEFMDSGVAKSPRGVKDNWKKYPAAMLRARVVSEGIRAVFPGVIVGIYTPEEVSDFEDKQRGHRSSPPPKAVEVQEDPLEMGETVTAAVTQVEDRDEPAVEAELVDEDTGEVQDDAEAAEAQAQDEAAEAPQEAPPADESEQYISDEEMESLIAAMKKSGMDNDAISVEFGGDLERCTLKRAKQIGAMLRKKREAERKAKSVKKGPSKGAQDRKAALGL